MSGLHPAERVAGVIAIPTPGQDLELNTEGWFDCPVSQCRWTFDPEAKCPDHGQLRRLA